MIRLISLLALSGCSVLSEGLPDYYADRVDPEISGLSVTSELGNIGGAEIAINGSGFGDDASDVVVLLGNHNAEILEVTDGSIRIRTPRGPITGGAVDVVVATAGGYTTSEDAYTYDTTVGGEDLYAGQTAYIAVQNMWTSCYGGMYDNPEIADCDTIAYFGQTGISGTSEWFRQESAYPRVHTTSEGWLTAADYAPDGWRVSSSFDSPFPSGIDDLRRHVGNFSLVNPAFAGEDLCIDPELDPAEGNEVACSESGALEYQLDELRFCEGEDPEEGPNFVYTADWPVKQDFFLADAEDPESAFDPVTIELNVPDQGLSGVELTLPGSLRVTAEQGFASPAAWALTAPTACLDGNGDGEALLDDEGIVLSWEPVPDEIELGGPGVEAVGSYVHVSVSFLPIGWFGLQLGGPRASVVVPDDNLYDVDAGIASVVIPNEVLYQIPTPNFQWSSFNNFDNSGTLGSYDSNASYVFLEIYRITDYRVDVGDGNTLIFSYVTGDLALPLQWSNPLERNGDCNDCMDGDGDGWVDALDPDCNEDVGGNEESETNATSTFTCNDGVDNNGDGLVDADDPLCDSGWAGETTCTDGVDNDGDGWTDALDGECVGDVNAQEDGLDESSWTCSDGLDNDGDGWVDSGDPGCVDGLGFEDDGFGTGACNDGIDNDGHGDVDAVDPYCAEFGATADAEVPTFSSGCVDGNDNDGDGFTDDMDPDCEIVRIREYADFFTEGDVPFIPACYDGIDNDGDGSVDGADASCWRSDLSFEPDGFLNDEGADHGTGCTDALDEDGDGWFDGEDPDCVAADPTKQDEVGFGTTVCNDGIDNNGDGKVDRESSYCKTAEGTFEGP